MGREAGDALGELHVHSVLHILAVLLDIVVRYRIPAVAVSVILQRGYRSAIGAAAVGRESR